MLSMCPQGSTSDPFFQKLRALLSPEICQVTQKDARGDDAWGCHHLPFSFDYKLLDDC